ncbi:MAG: class I SAM-dependent methyltransferase [Eubacterium sp.]
MEKIKIDNGQKFDFGKTSKEYSKYRDIYPQKLFDRLYELGIGKEGTEWLDLGTGTGVIPRGLAQYGANIIGTDIAENQIEEAKLLSKEFENISYEVCSAEDLNFPDNTFDVITACMCFWYFEPQIIVPKIKAMLKQNGMFMKIYMSYVRNDMIARESWALVKELNSQWSGGSGVKDLTTHYFDNPQMESFVVDLPFTRESWHGRMKASRGVLASMDEEAIKQFEEKHWKMMMKLPEEFTIKHKVFLTYYYMDN